MKRKSRKCHPYAIVSALVAANAVAATLMAAVIETDAVVSTTVQELIDGVPGSVTSDSEQLEGGLSGFPIMASGSLTSTDLDGALASMGQSISEMADPTRLDQPNPEEFALEVECYSNAESISYSVDGLAEEFRTVVLTTPGNPLAPPEIEFGSNSTRRVESRVFLSGAIIFWSTEPGQELDEMLSEVRVTVTREDTGATLFSTTLTLADEDGNGLTPTTTGPIEFEIVDLQELGDRGVDEATLAILAQVEDEGTLMVVVLPEQEHTYRYTVTADEPLVLKAQMSAQVRNVPGGTGAATTLGKPFENLAEFIEDGLPGVNGSAIQRSVNAATAARKIGLVVSPDSTSGGTRSRLCGAFGLESAALLSLGLCLTLGRSRRFPR